MWKKFVYLVFDNAEPGGAGSAPPAAAEPPAGGEPPAAAEPPAGGEPPAAAEPPDDDGVSPTNPDGSPIMVPLAKAQAEKARRIAADKRAQEAETNAAYYRGLAERPTAAPPAAPAAPPAPPAPPVEPVKPLAKDFDEYVDFEAAEAVYNQAHTNYVVERAKFELKQESARDSQVQQQRQTEAQINQGFQTRLAAEAALDPDIINLANTFHLPGPNQIPLTGPMQDAIRESEVGPKLLRHFANNKPEALRLAGMSPVTQIREIGRIEAAIINKPTPPARHVSAAPEPIKPVDGSGTVETDEDKMPMSEYLARERAKKTEQRKRS